MIVAVRLAFDCASCSCSAERNLLFRSGAVRRAFASFRTYQTMEVFRKQCEHISAKESSSRNDILHFTHTQSTHPCVRAQHAKMGRLCQNIGRSSTHAQLGSYETLDAYTVFSDNPLPFGSKRNLDSCIASSRFFSARGHGPRGRRTTTR